MIRAILALLTITVLLGTVFAVSENDAYAKSSKWTNLDKICGDKICDTRNDTDNDRERQEARDAAKSPYAPPVEPEPEAEPEEAMDETMMKETTDDAMMEDKMDKKLHHGWQTSSGTLTSKVDPGIGHETHQLVQILGTSEGVYKGILSYSASEPIQLIVLHGPLAEGEDNGQPTWTIPADKSSFGEESTYAITFIDPKTAMGSFVFTGSGLAVHTMNQDEFSVSYSVSYMEKEISDTVATKTISSIVDPGMGHETHQLTIILPPSENVYGGLLTYSASEPIQLVTLHGPLGPGEDAGQKIWTLDDETKFGLTIVDNKSSMGTWAFAGNALAVHTMNEEQFTISYSVVAGQ